MRYRGTSTKKLISVFNGARFLERSLKKLEGSLKKLEASLKKLEASLKKLEASLSFSVAKTFFNCSIAKRTMIES
jgi:septal ring factor EnvC (AmiA/AmiB activator)